MINFDQSCLSELVVQVGNGWEKFNSNSKSWIGHSELKIDSCGCKVERTCSDRQGLANEIRWGGRPSFDLLVTRLIGDWVMKPGPERICLKGWKVVKVEWLSELFYFDFRRHRCHQAAQHGTDRIDKGNFLFRFLGLFSPSKNRRWLGSGCLCFCVRISRTWKLKSSKRSTSQRSRNWRRESLSLVTKSSRARSMAKNWASS